MKKTLLLCFIHGFKGGEDTFGDGQQFTHHLRELVAEALPKVNVYVIIYPKYETRGDLGECVSRFRDWLLEKVIDLEVAAGAPSPTVDPSVRVVLAGHSMGGIVAAETVVALTSEKAIGTGGQGAEPPTAAADEGAALNGLMFPYVQGVLAFDTPYLGISPGVVAHGAEGHYLAASSALSQLSGLGALWGGGQAPAPAAGGRNNNINNSERNRKVGGPSAARGKSSSSSSSSSQSRPRPQPRSQSRSQSQAQAQAQAQAQQDSNSGWGWGKIAMVAGAAGALAAGSAAAYLKRDEITEGWSWATSHLEFVGCLARGEDLRRRVAYMVRARDELGLGFANLYTRLGQGAPPKQVSLVGTVLGPDRTFCNLPSKQAAGDWKAAVNDKASDETGAHVSMFLPKDNPGYKQLLKDAKKFIVQWTRNDWYESSTEAEIKQAEPEYHTEEQRVQ